MQLLAQGVVDLVGDIHVVIKLTEQVRTVVSVLENTGMLN